MRALIVAFALVFAAGSADARLSVAPTSPEPRLAAPAAILLAANTPKPIVAKRCGSRGGYRSSRSYYGYGC